MANLQKRQLLSKITRAVEESGWNVLYLSSQHPFNLRVSHEDESYLIRVYIWNITHGGGQRRPTDEYRVQITGIDNAAGFLRGDAEKVLILGWWEEGGVFAGFDFRSHTGSLGSSPSIQIKEEALLRAAASGVATHMKGSGEIAVAFKPIFFTEYIRNLESLHSFGESQQDREVLEAIIENPEQVAAQQSQVVDTERRTVLTTVAKKLRDSSFKDRVLCAYSQKCAFCNLQLRLVDAAHIVPVSSGGSDGTENGIALCALHHRAFDRALITTNERFQIVLNPGKLSELKVLGLDEGLAAFKSHLRAIIHLPPAKTDRPNIHLIQEANRLRGWMS